MDFPGTKKLLQMVSHEELKCCFLWDLKCVLPENIHTPPPTEDSLICTPTLQDFLFQGVFDDPLPPGGIKRGLR